MKRKPRLNFWQLWNMSFGYVGIQFGFALQNANVSRIFETLGAKVENIPILWIAAPVSGSAHPADHRPHERQDLEPVWAGASLISWPARYCHRWLC